MKRANSGEKVARDQNRVRRVVRLDKRDLTHAELADRLEALDELGLTQDWMRSAMMEKLIRERVSILGEDVADSQSLINFVLHEDVRLRENELAAKSKKKTRRKRRSRASVPARPNEPEYPERHTEEPLQEVIGDDGVGESAQERDESAMNEAESAALGGVFQEEGIVEEDSAEGLIADEFKRLAGMFD